MTVIHYEADSNLAGYGFDLEADRVVRFNKHPDGTYLNTRATYSINKCQFTHYDLRKTALQISTSTDFFVEDVVKVIKTPWKISAIIVAVAILMMLSECSTNFSVNVYSTQSHVQADQ